MTSLRAKRFAKLERIERYRQNFTFSVVAPTTFCGTVRETAVACGEWLRWATR